MKKSAVLYLIGLIGLCLLTWLILTPAPITLAQNPPPPRPSPPPPRPNPPPPRPQPPTPPSPPTALTGSTTGRENVTWSDCSTVHGFVVNWGFRNEPKIPVQLTGADWQNEKITDDNGYYAFECLGLGIGLVNLTVPPGLHPLTTDVALRLGYWPDFEINLGLYGGEIAPAPEVTPTLTVTPNLAAPGQPLTYTLGVINTSGSKMAGVMMTNLLPGTLKLMEATSTVGSTELWDNLLTADIGELSPGQAVTVTLVAVVQPETITGAVITNQASLIYSGHVVRQTMPITLEVGKLSPPAAEVEAAGSEFKPPAVLPETGAEYPVTNIPFIVAPALIW